MASRASGAGHTSYLVVPHLVADIGTNGRHYTRPYASFSTLECLAADGMVLWTAGGSGTGAGQLNGPRGAVVDANQSRLYVADTGNNRIQVFTTDGAYVSHFGSLGGGNGELRHPSDVSVDAAGLLYVSDTLNHRIQVFDAEGQFVRTFGSLGTSGAALNGPRGIGFHPDGALHVVDSGNARVQMYSATGEYRGSYGRRGVEVGHFRRPLDITFDGEGRSHVTDPIGRYVRIFGPLPGQVERLQPTFGGGPPAAPRTVETGNDGTIVIGAVAGPPAPVLFFPLMGRSG